MIKICFVDSHELSREGLALLLGQQEDFEVTGKFVNAGSLMDKISEVDLDVLIIDEFLNDSNAISLTRFAKQVRPTLKIICLTLGAVEIMPSKLYTATMQYFVKPALQTNCLI